MTSYLPYDLQSLIGVHKGTPSQTPEIGDSAPQLEDVNYSSNPHLIAFVRHCGCPFAEAEVKSLGNVQKSHSQVKVIIIAHSEQDVVNEWFDRVGKSSFSSLENVTVLADPKYEVYDKFGIGQLGWSGLFSSSMITELRSLASQGIKNTSTGKGSNRWQNSGGYELVERERRASALTRGGLFHRRICHRHEWQSEMEKGGCACW
jgi:hypothetical protein